MHILCYPHNAGNWGHKTEKIEVLASMNSRSDVETSMKINNDNMSQISSIYMRVIGQQKQWGLGPQPSSCGGSPQPWPPHPQLSVAVCEPYNTRHSRGTHGTLAIPLLSLPRQQQNLQCPDMWEEPTILVSQVARTATLAEAR